MIFVSVLSKPCSFLNNEFLSQGYLMYFRHLGAPSTEKKLNADAPLVDFPKIKLRYERLTSTTGKSSVFLQFDYLSPLKAVLSKDANRNRLLIFKVPVEFLRSNKSIRLLWRLGTIRFVPCSNVFTKRRCFLRYFPYSCHFSKICRYALIVGHFS